MQPIGILLNPLKENALSFARDVEACCHQRGLELIRVDGESFPEQDMSVLIVLGGDGTILRAASECARRDIPILGVNLGRLGFLTEIEPGDVENMLLALTSGAYTLERRMLMQVTLPCGDTRIELHDVVVSRGNCSRMISLEARATDAVIDDYIADGLIVSTPTGSTAYSLSAGGPVVSPDVQCFILSPICAHSLKSRPIVVSDKEILHIRIHDHEVREGMKITVDGQEAFEMQNHQEIILQRAKKDLLFVRLQHTRNFFTLLRSKLSDWS